VLTFAQATDALSFGALPWVALYQLAQREISTINTAADATEAALSRRPGFADMLPLLAFTEQVDAPSRERLRRSATRFDANVFAVRAFAQRVVF